MSGAQAQVLRQTQFTTPDGWELGNAMASDGNTLVIGDKSWQSNSGHGVVGAAYIFTWSNGQWTQVAELTASDGQPYDQFGSSVAISGSTVVIGAVRHHKTGAAYVFTLNNGNWAQQQEILPADGRTGDYFGSAVAVYQNTLAVGACRRGSWAAGTVYTYGLSSGQWTKQMEWSAPSPTKGSSTFFGFSLALSGTGLAVGAPGANYGYGAAYAYGLSGGKWQQQAVLTAPGESNPGQFGYALALSGSGLAVGAPGMSAAYTFAQNAGAWSLQSTLAPFEGASIEGFGHALAINGNTLVVSALNPEDTGAYVFDFDGTHWNPVTEIVPTDIVPQANTQFGAAVAIVGSSIVVARPNTWNDGNDPFAVVGTIYCYTPVGAETMAADGQMTDDFGYATAFSGSNVFVSAPGRNQSTGGVYAFTLTTTGFVPQMVFAGADSQVGDSFGSALAFDGVTLYVGAPNGNNGAGSVYVFTNQSGVWTQQAELTAADGVQGDLLGSALAIAGNTLFVGAPGKNGNAGGLYIFTAGSTGWTQQAELADPGGIGGDSFGWAVSTDGRSLVVGAPQTSTTFSDLTGCAYVYMMAGGTWNPMTTLVAADGQMGDGLGSTVAVSGGVIAAGAPFSYGDGAVYTFAQTASGWIPQAELEGGTAFDSQFGAALALSGNTLVVGAPGGIGYTGQVYVLTLTNGIWSMPEALTSQDGQNYDYFGAAVALSGGHVLVGAPYANYETGSIYVY